MRFQNSLNPLLIGDGREALVVYDDIESVRPVWIFVQRNLGVGAGAPLLDDGPDNIGTG